MFSVLCQKINEHCVCTGLPVVAHVKSLVLGRASCITRTSLLRKWQLGLCCRDVQGDVWLPSCCGSAKKRLFKGPLYPYRFWCVFQLILSGTGGEIKGA